LVEAKRIPLDVYIMLDVSGSMLETTEGDAAVTKWQAVSSALVDFVSDDASAGMSVGLQVFPLRHPKAPKSCATDAECGTEFGRCLTKTCWTATVSLAPCADDSECDDVKGDCIPFGFCKNNEALVCRNPGGDCGTDDATGEPLGACVPQVPECTLSGDCRAIDYATPKVPIGELPAAKAALVSALEEAMPDRNGLTPSGPALAGALSLSSTWAQAHPDRQVVAVFATDGMPTLESQNQVCQPVLTQAQVDAVANLAAGGKQGNPPISTFVIGVIGAEDTGAKATLNHIARSGGTSQAFIVDTTGDLKDNFRSALNQIRESGLACDLAVPEAAPGKTADYDKVNVDFTNKSGNVEHLLNVPDAGSCSSAPSSHGWYYDTDPKVAKPTRIIACPASCTEFQSTDTGSVQISIGCATRTVVK